MMGNLVLRRHTSGAKNVISKCISEDIPPQMKILNYEFGYPHFNALLQFRFELEHCKARKAVHHPT